MKAARSDKTIVSAAWTLFLLAVACTTNYPENAVEGIVASSAAQSASTATYAAASIRRLSNTQIVNSIQDVFMGGAALDADLLPLARVRAGFDDQDAMLAVNTPWMTLVQQASEQASAYVAAHLPRLAGCDPAETACIRTYIQKVGRLAFRRPLTDEEVANYMELVASPPAGTDVATAVGQVAEAMIQSPFFVYRTELGVASPQGSTAAPLAPYETAAAIAYFVLNSAPDEGLLDAAANNELAMPEQRAAQVVRLMATPRAEVGLWNFMRQWANISSDSVLHGTFGADPDFTASLAVSAVQQVRLGFAQEIFNGEGKWKNLLLSNKAYTNADLLKIDPGTGVRGGNSPLDGNFVSMSYEPDTHSGFFTQAAFLASQSDPKSFSPIHFGFYVATGLFCLPIPQPPPIIPELPPDANGTMTPRQRFAAHLTNPACSNCHVLFQPLGWAFEQYKPIGAYAPDVPGMGGPLTGAGSITGTDVDGAFVGARGLAERIAISKQAKTCFVAKMYEYALGRPETSADLRSPTDQASITTSATAFINQDTSITSLLISVVQSEAFMLRDTSRVPAGARP